ncbi:MAG: AAA family ATPase [Actinomycetota bacterium]
MEKLYVRNINSTLTDRLREPRRLIQVLSGPRQVGKTTAVKQVLDSLGMPNHYVSADLPTTQNETWLELQWEKARSLAGQNKNTVLVLDEVQKITRWSDTVKGLWDEDTRNSVPLQVVILGSSPLLMQSGLTESLAGRFETTRVGHWTFRECREYFGWDADTFIFYGGYPGAAPLIQDHERWLHYIQDSLIETTISCDVLLVTRIDKPALLRRLFLLACEYSGQIVTYNHLIGQLQDAGNTTTLAHYLDLLGQIGFVAGLQKYSGQAVRQRGSSPKLQVFNTALMSANSGLTFRQAKADGGFWGRLVESAVGAYLINKAFTGLGDLFYWRERDKEVDFVFRAGKILDAIEVKSGQESRSLAGLALFGETYPQAKKVLVGADGTPIADFLSAD